MSDFFKALKKQTAQQPTPEFNRRFWTDFDSEFANRPAAFRFSWKIWIPALATAATILVTTGVFWKSRLDHGNTTVAAAAPEVMDVMDKQEMLAQLDLLEAFDNVPGGLPVSDEDWETLLPEGVPSA